MIIEGAAPLPSIQGHRSRRSNVVSTRSATLARFNVDESLRPRAHSRSSRGWLAHGSGRHPFSSCRRQTQIPCSAARASMSHSRINLEALDFARSALFTKRQMHFLSHPWIDGERPACPREATHRSRRVTVATNGDESVAAGCAPGVESHRS
jgi:hypothetical protein